MKLTRFILPIHLRTVVKNLGRLTQLFAVLMSAPLLVSLVAGEFALSILFFALAVVTFVLGKLADVESAVESGIKEAVVITALAYVLYAVLSAAAFVPSLSFIDALFEAVSGITTTGLSVVTPESLPRTLLFFRCYLQWIGGAGIVVLSLCMLLGPGRNAFRLYTTEFGEENLIADVKETSRLVIKIYLLFTAAGFLAFIASGMPAFEALLHIMSTVSTGGFSAHGKSIGYYDSSAISAVVSLFMILGAIGFPTYYALYRKGLRRFGSDPQVIYLAAFIILFFTLAVALFQGPGVEGMSAFFHVASALTTTGFSTAPSSEWPVGFKWLAILLMTVGGCAGSTAGGLKLFRLIMMVQLVKWMVLHILLPQEAKIPIKIGRLTITDREIKTAFGFAAAYMLFIFVTAFLLTVLGYPAVDSLFESTSALGTVGLSVGITSAELPVWAKGLLAFNMWAGRLEILPVLVVLNPKIWAGKRSSS